MQVGSVGKLQFFLQFLKISLFLAVWSVQVLLSEHQVHSLESGDKNICAS